MSKRLITAADVREAAGAGKKSLAVPSDCCIVTPMARDEAIALNVKLESETSPDSPSSGSPSSPLRVQPDRLANTVSALLQARGIGGHEVEKMIREVVEAKLGNAATQPSAVSDRAACGNGQGVRLVEGRRFFENAGAALVDEKMLVANVVGGETGDKLAGGYMVWDKAAFPRVLDAPEIAIVIEGELHLIVDGDTMIAKPGDMIYFPEGAAVEYKAPAAVKLACVNRL